MTIWPRDYYDPSLDPPEGSDPPERIVYIAEVAGCEHYLCASCGLKDEYAVRLGPQDAAHVITIGEAEVCGDCGEEF